MTASTLPDLLQQLLADDPARPLITFYDDATGERVELSVKSFENWVAKTANLLQDELSVEPGESIALWLPAHWQSAVWVFAAASCGVTVALGVEPSGTVDVAVCGPDDLERAQRSGAHEVVALSLRPMGQGFADDLPTGVVDYAATVLAQGDVFHPVQPVDPRPPFAVSAAGSLAQAELLDRARERAASHGVGAGGRLLTDANPAEVDGLAGGVLAALAVGGSLVLTRNPDPAAVDGRAAQEQVTAQWWCGG